MKNLIDTFTYHYEDEQGKQRHLKVKYSIVLKNDKVKNVFNEYNNSVEKNSEVFEYYSNYFNK
jgi:hypothetical protein